MVSFKRCLMNYAVWVCEDSCEQKVPLLGYTLQGSHLVVVNASMCGKDNFGGLLYLFLDDSSLLAFQGCTDEQHQVLIIVKLCFFT